MPAMIGLFTMICRVFIPALRDRIKEEMGSFCNLIDEVTMPGALKLLFAATVIASGISFLALGLDADKAVAKEQDLHGQRVALHSPVRG
jgi:hypothetical protein